MAPGGRSVADNGIIATGEATIAWLRDTAGLAGTTNETATHAAIALRYPQSDRLYFVEATPAAGVTLTPEAEFWARAAEGTVFYRGAG